LAGVVGGGGARGGGQECERDGEETKEA